MESGERGRVTLGERPLVLPLQLGQLLFGAPRGETFGFSEREEAIE